MKKKSKWLIGLVIAFLLVSMSMIVVHIAKITNSFYIFMMGWIACVISFMLDEHILKD